MEGVWRAGSSVRSALSKETQDYGDKLVYDAVGNCIGIRGATGSIGIQGSAMPDIQQASHTNTAMSTEAYWPIAVVLMTFIVCVTIIVLKLT
jgi:hypothetical protein